VLLEAAARLAPQRPSLRVMVVGGVHRSGADYAEELRALADDPALAGRVVFTGERADVADLMAAMDVVVHTSVRGEPFGRVIIEAMSVERPVVATRAGGVPEFVSDGVDGLLVAPGDAGELAETLDRVLSDPILATGLSLGAAAKAEYFAVARHVREVTALWEAVLAGGPAPAAEPVPGAVA
jgi:glycosyltransferase involved in cell wall biosynthesis